MRIETIALLAAATFGSASHAGEILRCTGAGGETIYTNIGCPANTQAQHVSSYEPVPDAPQPAYSRAAEEAALSASRAELAAERAEAAAYRQSSSYYEAPEESERGGPYHQHEDNNVYYPAWFGGYPLLGTGNRNHHVGHHGAFARGGGGHHDPGRGTHPQPVKFAGGPRR